MQYFAKHISCHIHFSTLKHLGIFTPSLKFHMFAWLWLNICIPVTVSKNKDMCFQHSFELHNQFWHLNIFEFVITVPQVFSLSILLYFSFSKYWRMTRLKHCFTNIKNHERIQDVWKKLQKIYLRFCKCTVCNYIQPFRAMIMSHFWYIERFEIGLRQSQTHESVPAIDGLLMLKAQRFGY